MTTTLGIDHITIKGFKSLAAIEKLPLKPINLIIGANGSGKSNFINTFSFLHAIKEGRLHEYVRKAGGSEQLLHYGSKTTQEILIHISFHDEENQYKLRLIPTDTDDLVPASEVVYFWNKAAYSAPYYTNLDTRENGQEAGISEASLTKTPGWVRKYLGSWRLYHVHDTSATSPLRKTGQVNDNSFFRPDGSNLPSFLYLLHNKYPREYKLIQKTIQMVTPFFDDFILEPDRLNEDSIRLVWKHKESDQYFNASSLSDGTMRFIALAVLLLQPEELRPSIILVDEPELGLHPSAIQLLANMVQEASLKTQVILSTQSSLLLDHFEPEDVLVAERIDGGTQFKRLEETELKMWLEDYSLGQLWEKNQLGGRPK